jgi:hypothetical protein
MTFTLYPNYFKIFLIIFVVGVVHGGVFFFKWGIFSKLGDFVPEIQKSKSIGLHNAK